MLQGAISLFWFVFLADGILSVTDELASLVGGVSSLGAVRSAVAFLVLGGSVAIADLVSLTPRAPKRALVPLILFVWWAGAAMAFPLTRWNVPHLALGLAIAQLLLALMLLYFCRGGRWNRPLALNEAPVFSWRYSALAVPATIVLFPVVVVASTLSGFTTQIELLTGGYVRVRLDGIYLVERKFMSGDREVQLTGMMHVASREFYSNLLTGLDPAVPSVVLVEGVTDRRRDILFARNQRLAAEIESSLKDYRRVIVPWGAMHLPEIESWLQMRHFIESDEIERKALGFW